MNIDKQRLGVVVHLDTTATQFDFIKNQSQVSHVRFTGYAWKLRNDPTYKLDFYTHIDRFRQLGLNAVIVFHEMTNDEKNLQGVPDSVIYGDELPQIIAETIRPSASSGVIRAIDDVVIAVQPGNENNVDAPNTTPHLRGLTQYDRGASHAEVIIATRNVLDAVGAVTVGVWTAGTAGNPREFFGGLLDNSATWSKLSGLAVHCYGWPPDHQLEEYGLAAKAARDTWSMYGLNTPIYATEVGSQSLAEHPDIPCTDCPQLYGEPCYECDGAMHVQNALWWLAEPGKGLELYARAYWYGVSQRKPVGDDYTLAGDGQGFPYKVRLAGQRFRDYPRF